MPKNAVKRLQQIENDLKTVISIYEVSQKCKDKHEKAGVLQLQQIPELETLASIKTQPSLDVCSTVENTNNSNEKSPQSCTSSSEREVSRSKPKDVIDNNCSDTNVTLYSEKLNAEKQNGLVSSENSTKYPHWLVQDHSNWFGSIKHSDKVKNNRKHESSNEEKERKKKSYIKNSQDILKMDEKELKSIKTRSIRSRKSSVKDTKNGKVVKNKQELSQDSSADLNQKASKHQNGELSKMIERSNEKLENLKVSKELALDIAKYLKEKYDEIQQSKKELMEKLQQVEKDNNNLKSELKNEQLKAEELKESRVNLLEQDMKTKEELKILKSRICELEKEHHEGLLKKQKEIEKIQEARLAEIGNELKNKENQTRDIQRLSNDKCQLLAKNDQLLILLNDRNLQIEYQYEKIRRLEEEVRTQRQNLEKKAKVLVETNKELKQIRQTSSELEQKVIILTKNNENLEETRNNLTKQIKDLEKQLNYNQEEIKKLNDENTKLKTELENEKDGLLIKSKIIEDQQETIKQLKEKSEEAKSLLKKKESLERILNTEMEEKLELQEAVKRLKNRKEELKEKIKVLENDVLLEPQELARDLQKTKIILFELENQVHNKQKEWELQLHSLIREKEQACSVAEYATKKLIQTSSEFQKQTEAHKRLCKIVAANLAEKEDFDESLLKI